MEIFIVYKTDYWHSYASRDMIGASASKNGAIELCNQRAKKEHAKIDEDQLFNLRNISQTQGYSGEGEFDIDEIALDTLL